MDIKNSFGPLGLSEFGIANTGFTASRRLNDGRRKYFEDPVLDPDPAREPASLRRRPDRKDVRHRVRGPVGVDQEAEGDQLPARARAAAGLHRCARRCRSGRHARCARARWAPIRDCANPLIPADLVIDHSVQVDKFGSTRRLRAQRAARIPAQPGALRAAALGPDGLPQFPRRAARYRASCTR